MLPPESTLRSDSQVWEEHNARLAALIARARLRDEAAFDELYRLSARWMLGRIRRFVDDGQAEDVLAETYIHIWKNLDAYDESRGHPRAWMATIARSRAIDHLRRESRAKPEAEEPAAAEACDGERPDDLLSRAQQSRLVHAGLGELDAQERLVLALAYFRDCTQAEIAFATGICQGTVKTLMASAQRKLRIRLSSEGGFRTRGPVAVQVKVSRTILPGL